MSVSPSTLMPPSVKRGLYLAWFAFFVGVVANLGATMWLAFPGAQFTPRSIGPLLLVAALQLLPPGFLWYWVTLGLLIFIRRGIGWLRWLFAAAAVKEGALFVFTRAGPTLDLTLDLTLGSFVSYVHLGLVLANAVAAGLLFSPSSNAWFSSQAKPVSR